MARVRWLDDRQQEAWRAYVTATGRLQERLDAELVAAHGLSLAEYETLAFLSEAPGGRLRMSDLAAAVLTSKSRLTHRVDALESAGLVQRERCSADRRGRYAVLTPAGRTRLEEAAPTHVEGVRRYLVDALSERQLTAMKTGLCTVIAALECADESRR